MTTGFMPARARHLAAVLFAALLLIGAVSLRAQQAPWPQQTAQSQQAPRPQAPPGVTPRSGADIYRSACETCHGPDGKGSPLATVGFTAPLPDFTDCAFATTEPDPDWQAVVHEGGPIRGLDRHMPAFGDALTADEVARAVTHLRGFCGEASWPRGDLNLPRAFFTEKAFPENEVIWATAIDTGSLGAVQNTLIYERRMGARNQVEINVPVDFRESQAAGGAWNRGLGDVAFAFKRTFHANIDTGTIGAAGLEVILPTGKEDLGLGGGATVIEPFVLWGQMLPRNTFVQFHAGAELPAGDSSASREVFVRAAWGATLAQDRGFGRAWSPQMEVLWARPEGGASEWDAVPQVQVTLSKLQHVMLAGGARIPLTRRQERSTQVLVYLLWDWFDGGFFEFWR
jgi:mono/diheme cytochrome c family protein